LNPPPPAAFTTVFFGKTGVGKTTTINALFGTRWATDHAKACTTEPAVEVLDRARFPGLTAESHRVVDLPGIGESLEADESYFPFYLTWASAADRLIWITQADTRAYKRDELFLERLRGCFRPHLEFILCLNKIDSLGVDEGLAGFDQERRQPSAGQLAHLPVKIADVHGLFSEALAGRVRLREENILPCSVKFDWGLHAVRQLFFLEGQNRHV
jgi:predicted GTPase